MEYFQDWNWVQYLELAAALLGFVAITFQIKQIVWYWLVSIVMVSMYIVVYIHYNLYGDMSLQFYYLIISFYGWYMWLFGKQTETRKAPISVSKASKKVLINSFGIAILFFAFSAYILDNFTPSDVPYLDAFTTALSFVATWMLARKIIENWLIWIVADAVSVGLYIYKGLYPTAVLFSVLTVLAIVGYYKWKEDLMKNND